MAAVAAMVVVNLSPPACHPALAGTGVAVNPQWHGAALWRSQVERHGFVSPLGAMIWMGQVVLGASCRTLALHAPESPPSLPCRVPLLPLGPHTCCITMGQGGGRVHPAAWHGGHPTPQRIQCSV